jgi:putative photosynthetic complex assembly protein
MTHAPLPNPAHAHDLHPPRGLLMAVGALVLFTLIGVGATRLAGLERATDWRALSAESLSLTFEDAADGGVIVRAAETGAVVREWPPETGGFVRTAMRALALERRQMGIGPAPAFLLHRTDNGKLILEDPETGKWVSLDAFGGPNAGEFGALFPASESGS